MTRACSASGSGGKPFDSRPIGARLELDKSATTGVRRQFCPVTCPGKGDTTNKPSLHSDVKALVFDLDGTLYTSAPLGREIMNSAVGYIADLKGVGDEEAELLIRETRNRLSSAGCKSTLSRASIALGGDLRELHRRFAAEIRPELFLSRSERVMELLQKLGARFELYIYTNNNRYLAEKVLSLLGVAGLFRQIYSIEDTWRPKPDRSGLEEIFRRIGKRPEECLFIGDRYNVDLRLPAEIGCAVFLVKTSDDLQHLCTLLNGEKI
jgi:putative hydrolase of the HAD superfamily